VLVLALQLLLSQAPPLPPGLPAPGTRGAKTPPASETARLYFLAGDPAKAMEWCRKGLKKEPKVCRAMLKALAEYEFLASHRDTFTVEQARDFVRWDRAIAPGAWSKLTEPTLERFVHGPVLLARRVWAAGDLAQAKKLVAGALTVEPKDPQALALKKELDAVRPDAGAP